MPETRAPTLQINPLDPVRRRLSIGAELLPGGVHFRVWAPASRTAKIEYHAREGSVSSTIPLDPEPGGYFFGFHEHARAGDRYKIKLDHGSFPDPASRFQPEGPHGPSEIVDSIFAWTDQSWRGRPTRELVIYEFHLGTFTREGTWRAAAERLDDLAKLGVTMLEIMPVADFPGRFGWGYDGVNLFAPSRLYGTPDDARAFINRAHELGVAVILDVVYNHLGPDGNYLREFAPAYFTAKYKNEWGDPLNFEGPDSGPVREFFVTNARYWVEEFHFDGLRLDATQQMFDSSDHHILAEIAESARAAAPDRAIHLIAENECQHAVLVRSRERGGYALDAIWNEDFHHAALVAATGRAEAYFSGYYGTAQEFVSCAKRGFLFQGHWYAWQKRPRGRPALDLKASNFVHYLENHDQVANSLHGLRLHQMTSPGKYRALTALALLSPQIPMLFQGQEFATSAPFLYFADHKPELAPSVAKGRRGFLAQFPSLLDAEVQKILDSPDAPETFARCKIDWQERERHVAAHRLHVDLLRLRRENSTLAAQPEIDGAVLGEHAFVLRYFSTAGRDLLLVVNLGSDLSPQSATEPLLAPIETAGWQILWSSEAPCYGGGGTPPMEGIPPWNILGEMAILLEPSDARAFSPREINQGGE